MSNPRWKTEAEFFDREAAATTESLEPTDPLAIERYGRLRRRRFNKEYRYRVLGDLRGKRVLDVGCGHGTNACMLAKLGATVVGIDISPESIALATRRAELDDVARSTEFICSPLETAHFESSTFDLIWGDAILHHLLSDLDAVLERLARWAKPNGEAIFAEPVNLNRALRRLRLSLPIPVYATPDERPLDVDELAIIRRYLPDMRLRHFGLFGRLDRFVLVDHNYERSSLPRRALSSTLWAVDYALLSLPPLRSLAGQCVIHGRFKH